MMHFITKAMPIGYIDNKYHISKLKSRTCLIGYSGFISREYFFIRSFGGGHTHAHMHAHMHTHTHTHTHKHIHTHTDFPDESNIKEPGTHWQPALDVKFCLLSEKKTTLQTQHSWTLYQMTIRECGIWSFL